MKKVRLKGKLEKKIKRHQKCYLNNVAKFQSKVTKLTIMLQNINAKL
jgi:hypothetical protein